MVDSVPSRSIFASSAEGRLPPPVEAPTPPMGVGAALSEAARESSSLAQHSEITEDISDLGQAWRAAFSSDEAMMRAANNVAESFGESV